MFGVCVLMFTPTSRSSQGLPLWRALGSWWWTLTHGLPNTRALIALSTWVVGGAAAGESTSAQRGACRGVLASWAGPGSGMEKGGGCGRSRLLGGGMSSWAGVARVRSDGGSAARVGMVMGGGRWQRAAAWDGGAGGVTASRCVCACGGVVVWWCGGLRSVAVKGRGLGRGFCFLECPSPICAAPAFSRLAPRARHNTVVTRCPPAAPYTPTAGRRCRHAPPSSSSDRPSSASSS